MNFEEGTAIRKINMFFAGKKHEIVFRFVCQKDLEKIVTFVSCLVAEKAYLPNLRSEETPAWFEKNIESCKRGEGIFIVMEIDGEYVGHSLIERGTGETFHTGELGIVIVKEYRGVGLGGELMREIIDMAKCADGLEMLWLDYYGINTTAKKLYEKSGFKNAGRLRGMYKRGDDRFDKVVMFQEL